MARDLEPQRRHCQAVKSGGGQCRAPPLLESNYCLLHDPERSDEAAEARRLGGIRRRKETTLSAAYDFDELSNVDDIRRVLKIAVFDTLALENSVARNRTLAYLCGVALKAYDQGELEARLDALEFALGNRGTGGSRL